MKTTRQVEKIDRCRQGLEIVMEKVKAGRRARRTDIGKVTVEEARQVEKVDRQQTVRERGEVERGRRKQTDNR